MHVHEITDYILVNLLAYDEIFLFTVLHPTEFIPYVFQILSLLMEFHRGGVPDTYMALFPHLLTPVLWERPGNIPPLTRLIQAFIELGSSQIQADRLVR